MVASTCTVGFATWWRTARWIGVLLLCLSTPALAEVNRPLGALVAVPKGEYGAVVGANPDLSIVVLHTNSNAYTISFSPPNQGTSRLGSTLLMRLPRRLLDQIRFLNFNEAITEPSGSNPDQSLINIS
jgi:hypothetical protein